MDSVFESERLAYYWFTAADFEFYRKLVQSEKVMRYITERALGDDEASRKYKSVLEINSVGNNLGVFWVGKKGLGKSGFVGLAKVTSYPDVLKLEKESEIEIGYSLMPEFWSLGYGTEISICLVKYAKELKLNRPLLGIIDPANKPSEKILIKSGFSLSEVGELFGLPAAFYRQKV